MGLAARARRSAAFRARKLLTDLRHLAFAGALAWRRRFRLRDEVEDGVTVVCAAWNARSYLEALLEGFRRFTEPTVPLVVVDNASGDGTSELLAAHPEVRVIRLRRNHGHGLALDAGVQAAHTKYVVVIDADAFPIARGWIDAVVEPLEQGCTLAGAFSSGYVHPSFMALERERFLAEGYTFAPSYHRRFRLPHRDWPKGWDAGQLMTVLDEGRHHRIETTSVRGPGPLGTVYGDVVYHHWFSSRLAGRVGDDVKRKGVTPEMADVAWAEAIAKYLPDL